MRTTRIAVAAALAVGLGVASAGALDAKNDSCNRGNHDAVWSLDDVPGHDQPSGHAWGKEVSEWRMDTSGEGVSELTRWYKDTLCER